MRGTILFAAIAMVGLAKADRVAHAEPVPSLCEGYDEKRASTRAERSEVRKLITKTARSKGADPRVFHVWAERESSYRPFKRHRMGADVRGAMAAWVRAAPRYGWEVSWDRPVDRRLDQAKLQAIEADPNPTYADHERWVTSGLGLYGLNPALHLWRWSPKAQPEELCDPVVATEIARRLACKAVHSYGARNWLEVNSVFATGRIKSRPKLDQSFRRRARRHGFDPHAKPVLGSCDLGPALDQDAWVRSVYGGAEAPVFALRAAAETGRVDSIEGASGPASTAGAAPHSLVPPRRGPSSLPAGSDRHLRIADATPQ
jgi:hypothetical protein